MARLLQQLRPRLLDRYIIREILPPAALGLTLFSFVLLLEPISRLASTLVARGADFPTIVRIFLNLLPSIFATTVPMSFLLGVLVAFGRLASESEIVAMRASGLSAWPMVRPVMLLASAAFGVTFYIMTVALPEANQSFRQQFYQVIVGKARGALTPRVFDVDLLPNMVIYVDDIPAETGEWHDIFIYDRRMPRKPRVILARRGGPRINRDERRAELHLEEGAIHRFDTAAPAQYEQQAFVQLDTPLDFSDVFPDTDIARGDREMSLRQLEDKIAELAAGGNPDDTAQRYAVEWHKRFAIPTACLVFGILGVALSLGSRREARSSAFAVSLAVIFAYYILIRVGEQAGDTGAVSPFLAMWTANIVLAVAGAWLLVLNHKEAAFDPFDLGHYASWLPKIRRGRRAEPGAERPQPAVRPVRVVVRIPRVTLPVPGLLDRYLIRQYAGHFALTVAALVSIFVIAEVTDLLDDMKDNDVAWVVLFRYYSFHIFQIVYLMVPVAHLVAPLVTFGVLSRRNEITAIKAGGVSLYRAVLPIVVVGLASGVSLYVLGDYVLPETNRAAEPNFNIIKGKPPQSTNVLEQRWILGSDQESIYNYDYLSEFQTAAPGGRGGTVTRISLYGLSVFRLRRDDWGLADRLYSSRATWNDPVYELDSGFRLTLPEQADGRATYRSFDFSRTRAVEPPSYFMQEVPKSDLLPFVQLARHIGSLERRGFDVAQLRVQLHRKLSFPAVALVMTLIGIPFAFVVGRRGALYGIGISLIIAIVYWTTMSTFEGLGNHGQLPPIVAAWAANILFTAGGAYLLLTVET